MNHGIGSKTTKPLVFAPRKYPAPLPSSCSSSPLKFIVLPSTGWVKLPLNSPVVVWIFICRFSGFGGGTITAPTSVTSTVSTILLTRLPPPKVTWRLPAALGPLSAGETYFSPTNVTLVVNPDGKYREPDSDGRNHSTVAPTELLVPNVIHPIDAPWLLYNAWYSGNVPCLDNGTRTLSFAPSANRPLSRPGPVGVTVNVPYPNPSG